MVSDKILHHFLKEVMCGLPEQAQTNLPKQGKFPSLPADINFVYQKRSVFTHENEEHLRRHPHRYYAARFLHGFGSSPRHPCPRQCRDCPDKQCLGNHRKHRHRACYRQRAGWRKPSPSRTLCAASPASPSPLRTSSRTWTASWTSSRRSGTPSPPLTHIQDASCAVSTAVDASCIFFCKGIQ